MKIGNLKNTTPISIIDIELPIPDEYIPERDDIVYLSDGDLYRT